MDTVDSILGLVGVATGVVMLGIGASIYRGIFGRWPFKIPTNGAGKTEALIQLEFLRDDSKEHGERLTAVEGKVSTIAADTAKTQGMMQGLTIALGVKPPEEETDDHSKSA